jgi:hypothetical protein
MPPKLSAREIIEHQIANLQKKLENPDLIEDKIEKQRIRCRERARETYANNPDKIKKTQEKYLNKDDNREKQRIRSKEYYWNNRETILQKAQHIRLVKKYSSSESSSVSSED